MNQKFNIRKIEQMITELMNTYIEIVSFFKCSKCGICCQRSPNLLFSDEFKNFDKDIIYMEDGLYGMKDPCPFFVDNICNIHNTKKPRLCRLAPFIINNKTGQIILSDCELGKNIYNKYNVFIKESNIEISENPFGMQIMNPFLDWLKETKETI